MSYSSTKPRPISSWTNSGKRVRQYSLDAIQKESTLDYGSVRQSIPDSNIPKLDTRTTIRVTRLRYDSSADEYALSKVDATTAEIFENPFILPYSLSTYKTPSPSLRTKLTQYARILDAYPLKYRPRLYSVTQFFLVDDLGRQYFINRDGYLVFYNHSSNGTRKPIKFGDGRCERSITVGSTTLRLALYTWNGIAGLTSTSQARIISSRGFDVHHGDENLYDVRPQSLFPIPSFLHRYVHGEYFSYSTLLRFFKH